VENRVQSYAFFSYSANLVLRYLGKKLRQAFGEVVSTIFVRAKNVAVTSHNIHVHSYILCMGGDGSAATALLLKLLGSKG
jgi:hypothetical protein